MLRKSRDRRIIRKGMVTALVWVEGGGWTGGEGGVLLEGNNRKIHRVDARAVGGF